MNDKNEVLIQVQDLKKAFGKLEVLRGISTEIKKGEVVVVIGPSGSGKSTFLRSLNLLEVPTGGTVLFEGASTCRSSPFSTKRGCRCRKRDMFSHAF